jgi:hypothetical protein
LLKWLITNWRSFLTIWVPIASNWGTSPFFHSIWLKTNSLFVYLFIFAFESDTKGKLYKQTLDCTLCNCEIIRRWFNMLICILNSPLDFYSFTHDKEA